IYAALLPYWFVILALGPGLASWGAVAGDRGLANLGGTLTTNTTWIVAIGEILTIALMILWIVMKPRLAFRIFSALLFLELAGLIVALGLLLAAGHTGFVNSVNSFMASQGYSGSYYADVSAYGAGNFGPYRSGPPPVRVRPHGPPELRGRGEFDPLGHHVPRIDLVVHPVAHPRAVHLLAVRAELLVGPPLPEGAGQRHPEDPSTLGRDRRRLGHRGHPPAARGPLLQLGVLSVHLPAVLPADGHGRVDLPVPPAARTQEASFLLRRHRGAVLR